MGCKPSLSSSSLREGIYIPMVPLQKTYRITTHSIEPSGVVLYHIESDNVVVTKRYKDFKVFHQEMRLLIEDLPPLPKAGLKSRFKRNNVLMIQARKVRFQEFLDYVFAFDDEILNTALAIFCAVKTQLDDDDESW
ncbi:hypothetical protein THRCLA_20340 [Thraustotheca clavata]|uniref:PX domain-containing protein n=1 Tax=Thraustotheca clavata TaxID=74557 RepID=A0A1W0A8N9_9STRA|nr:hypothetical protein THRCLA_20340 [Thraustotheca clavata]